MNTNGSTLTVRPDRPLRELLTSGPALVAYVALARLALHLWTNAGGGYGYFRDELYYLACADHLDAGYVDQPPLSIFVLAVTRLIFGDSLFALRLVPALAGAALVYLTGHLARLLGGGRTAQVLAALGACFSPILLGFATIYSMNALDLLFWTLAVTLSIRLVRSHDPRAWLALGLVIGLGALNKISMIWLGCGLVAGILLTPYRTMLRSRWALIAGAVALLCFLPYAVWNIMHEFAHLEFIRNATSGKYGGLSPLTFLRDQLLLHNPVAIPLWGAGLFFLLAHRTGKAYRFLGIAVLIVAGILIANGHSKGEYLAAAFPLLFAAGGVMIERWASSRRTRWVSPVYGTLLVVTGTLLVPVVVPILPVEEYLRYAKTIGIAPSTAENHRLGELPQFYADMFGWPEKVAAVAEVYYRLSPEERAKCAIFANNYGRCGAIDFFGKHYGLPKSIGGHNNYWIWGPRTYTGEIVIVLGGALRDKQETFEVVQVAGTVSCAYCMPYEDSLSIYLCRGLRSPIAERWPLIKHYE